MFTDLTSYMWIVWLVLIFAFAIIELLSLEFTFLMLAVGSLGGLGANLLGAPWWLQILVALVLSVLLLLTIRPVLLHRLRRGEDPTPSNVEALLGMTGRVLLAIGENGGQVKLLNGDTWTARLSQLTEAREVVPGERIVVTAIEGSTAIVVPAERNAPNG
jgi:membrane protein implicated in regulation of membrane protease activity